MSENNIAYLFKNDLEKVFSWCESSNYFERQFKQAINAYYNGDYLRSAILLYESYISFDMIKNGEVGNVTQYEARSSYEQKLAKSYEYHFFEKLKVLRNTLAHNTQPSRRGNVDMEEIRLMRSNRDVFLRKMKDIFNELGDKI